MRSCLVLGGVVAGCASPGDTGHPEDSPLETVDVAIVGAGPAGMSAALEVLEAGRSVALIDLASEVGGTALLAAGFVFAAGTDVQADAGIEDSPGAAYTEWEDITGVAAESSPWISMYLENAPDEVVGWLEGEGVVFSGVTTDEDCGSTPRLHSPEGGGVQMMATLGAAIPDASLRLQTLATGLRTEDGRVVGVDVADVTTEAATGWIQAGAVILATGGFLHDVTRIPALVPEVSQMDDIYLACGPHADGDGLDWATGVGADTAPLEHIGFYGSGTPSYVEGEERGSARIIGVEHTVVVGDAGERFWPESSLGGFKAARTLLADHGGDAWAVFDSVTAENISFGALEGSTEHVDLDGLLERGVNAKQAQDLGSLAAAIGVEVATMVDTISRYNTDVSAGYDSTFDLPLVDMNRVETPPFTAVRLVAAAAQNFGGVRTDTSARIVDADGAPIPGLYGAGEVVGMAGGELGGWGFSGSIGACVYSGRIAGMTAAGELP